MKEEIKLELENVGQLFLKQYVDDLSEKNKKSLAKIVSCDDRKELENVIVELGDDFIKLPLPLEMIDGVAIHIIVKTIYSKLDNKYGVDWFELKALPIFKFLRGVV